MYLIDREFRMVPVDKGIVETDSYSLGSECVDIFTYKVSSARCICAFVVGKLWVKHAEAFMMFCGKNRIFHSGVLCLPCPLFGVEHIGIEIFEIFVVLFFGNFFSCFYPFVPCRHWIQSPVNKQSETVCNKPICITRCFSGNVTWHVFFPFCSLTILFWLTQIFAVNCFFCDSDLIDYNAGNFLICRICGLRLRSARSACNNVALRNSRYNRIFRLYPQLHKCKPFSI